MIDVRVGDSVEVNGFGVAAVDAGVEIWMELVGRVVEVDGDLVTVHDASLDGPQGWYTFDVDDVNNEVKVIGHAPC